MTPNMADPISLYEKRQLVALTTVVRLYVTSRYCPKDPRDKRAGAINSY